ncbi:unnamed protein product [Diamesa serratosioi]
MMRLKQLLKIVGKIPKVQARTATKCETKPDPCDCPTVSTTEVPEIAEGYRNLKITQSQFQAEDNLPIFLKRPADKYLFYTTLILCGFGIVGQLQLFYELAVPKKPSADE